MAILEIRIQLFLLMFFMRLLVKIFILKVIFYLTDVRINIYIEGFLFLKFYFSGKLKS